MLAKPRAFTHNSRNDDSGEMGCDCSDREFSSWIDAGGGAVGFVVVRRKPGLYPRTAASLHRRCVAALRFRRSRCRPDHGLHDPQQVPALAALPGLLQVGSGAERSLGGRTAVVDQACPDAQARQRQAGQAQEACQARRDLTARRFESGSGIASARRSDAGRRAADERLSSIPSTPPDANRHSPSIGFEACFASRPDSFCSRRMCRCCRRRWRGRSIGADANGSNASAQKACSE